MLCDGHFPQMWGFQAPFRIQASVGNEKSCCRAQCNALTRQQRLLLTRAFNKWLQMKWLEGKGLRGDKRTQHPSPLWGCHCLAQSLPCVSLPWSENTPYTGTLYLSYCFGFFFLAPLLPVEEDEGF